MNNPK
jgi:hypothetical protein